MARQFIGNAKGAGVSSLVREYYSSTSVNSPEGGEWSSTVPPLDSSHYLWTRLKATFTDGTVSTTEALREGMFGQEISDLVAIIPTPLTDEEIDAICV